MNLLTPAMPLFLARAKVWLQQLGPVRVAFIVSLLLSLIAVQKGTINRDGMLYVETARIFLEEGFRAAMTSYSWPFLSIQMAGVSRLTGLGLESSGYLLSALFMAGTCALLVACAVRLFPAAAWHVCLVILALPGFNGYRDELLREYGCWFFIMLALWLALRWSDKPRWSLALAAQGALAVAALFRPEALAIFPALALWQIFAAPGAERWLRLMMIGSLPALGFVVLLLLQASDQLNFGRLTWDLRRFNLDNFSAKAQAMAKLLGEYGSAQAPLILFFGSLAIIPLKFIGKMGVFIVPLFYSFAGQPMRATLQRCPVFAWAFLAHAIVLGIFVLELQFLAGRYLAPLLLFAAPFAGYGYWRLAQRLPRWRGAMMALALLVMLGNVVSFQPPKQHFVAAGKWLAANATESPRVYVESARAAYYAGWRYPRSPSGRTQLRKGLEQGTYDLVVLEISREEIDIGPWMGCMGLASIVSFAHPKGDTVIIARPAADRVGGCGDPGR